MSYSHAVVWIDHREAHVIRFNLEAHEALLVKNGHPDPHLHHKRGAVGPGHAAEDQRYYHAVGQTLAAVGEIMVVGPANAKDALVKHLHEHDPALAKKVVHVEPVDHPSEGELLAKARKYFASSDRLRPGQGINLS